MIPVKIKSISITDIGFVIFLKSDENEKVLPIFIGPVEAQSISMILMKNSPKRPLTHDLMKTVLKQVGYNVTRVNITAIKDETFYAKLYLQKEGFFNRPGKGEIEIDARPSDAISLALRFDSPIFVAENLMQEHSIFLKSSENEKPSTDAQSDKPKTKFQAESGDVIIDVSKKINEQLGIYEKMLEQAVGDDRFEEAASIRDQIDTLMKNLNSSKEQEN